MEKKLVRRVDELGRIVLPVEARNALGVGATDTMSITYNDDCIILKKEGISRSCIECGSSEHLRAIYICDNCLRRDCRDES